MKTKIYTKMLLPLSIFGLLFRTLEILFAIEPSSGFYYLESFIPLLCNIFIFLVIAFFISEIFLTKQESKTLRKRLGAISVPDKVIMIASAVFILGSALRDLLVEFEINFSYEKITDMFADSKIYILILAALSCIFIVFYVSDPRRYSVSSFMSILSLSLTFYYLLRLFTRFMDMNEILSKAYSTHTILLLGFIVLSCLNFSKLLAGLRVKRYFAAFGLCAFFLAVMHLVEFVIYFLPGNPYNVPVENMFSYIADFLVSLVILRFVILVSKKQDKATGAKNNDAVFVTESTEKSDNDDESNIVSDNSDDSVSIDPQIKNPN
jgi:hypothetical protein